MSLKPMNRRMFLRGATTTLGGLAVGGLVTGCGGSEPPPAVAAGATLEERAEAEGELLFYMNSTDYQQYLDGFAAVYPWVQTSSSIGSPGDMLSKVQTEFNANAPTADVILLNAAQRSVLLSGGMLQPLPEVPNVASYPADGDWADPDSLTFTFVADPRILIYNTNLIGSTPLVEDLFELIEPQWRDKIVMDRPQNVGTAAWWLASQRSTWGDAKWMQWLEGLKANNVQVVGSASNGFQAVVAGEFVMCVSSPQELANNPDAPVAANYYANMPRSPLMLAAPANADNPNVAALFINWVLSPEGQAVAASTSYTPIIGPSTFAELPPHASLTPPSVNQAYIDDPDSFLEVYNELWPA